MKKEKANYIYLSVDEVVPYENNARTHSDAQVEKIARSLKEFGFINPVLIDANNTIIAGHGRVLASKKIGLTEVPCLRVEHLTPEQVKAYVIADNKLAEDAGWDMNILDAELAELQMDGFDITLTGFDDIEQLNAENFGTDFSLPSGEKSELCQMTFTLHYKQKEMIEEAMKMVKDQIFETFGNENSNGNAIYEVVRQWVEQKTL